MTVRDGMRLKRRSPGVPRERKAGECMASREILSQGVIHITLQEVFWISSIAWIVIQVWNLFHNNKKKWAVCRKQMAHWWFGVNPIFGVRINMWQPSGFPLLEGLLQQALPVALLYASFQKVSRGIQPGAKHQALRVSTKGDIIVTQLSWISATRSDLVWALDRTLLVEKEGGLW